MDEDAVARGQPLADAGVDVGEHHDGVVVGPEGKVRPGDLELVVRVKVVRGREQDTMRVKPSPRNHRISSWRRTLRWLRA